MKSNQLLIFNCFIFLCFLLSPIDGSMLSIIAYATIANLLRPRSRYPPQSAPLPPHPQVPQLQYESSSPGHSGVSQILEPQSSQSFLTQSVVPSERGFGYPGGITIDNNPVTDWAKSLQSHPESQKVPSFYGSYPTKGYQIFNGPPPTSGLFRKKPGFQPVFKFSGIGDHFKSVPEKGLFQL
ncbi:uncharacterized protein LOC128387338 [Panonychus citri]|uniref:uncharacterized protein LOC128387338 n=1 Tax=Panonychus citri TaxID=50023 RepID=UPI00230746ED|nr:uncharacterized protein LOC128387338 [Panonychus citri]